MKKLTILISLFFYFSLDANCQVINGGDFEEYKIISMAGHKTENPKGWEAYNFIQVQNNIMLIHGYTKSEPHTGTYGLKLETKSAPQSAFNITPLNSALPQYFNGYFKCNLPPGDTAAIFIVSSTDSRYPLRGPIAAIKKVYGIENEYIPFTVPVNYTSSHADTFTIVITSHYPENSSGTTGSYLIVDDLSFSSFPLAIESPSESSSYNSFYPNPSNGLLNFCFNNHLNGIEIKNLSGEVIFKEGESVNDKKSIDVSSLEKGIYYLSEFSGGKYRTSKLVIQ